MKNISFRVFFSKLRFGVSYDPTRDWFTLLSLAAVTLAAIIGWNLWTFSALLEGSPLGTPAQTPNQTLNGTTIDAVHAVFESRAAEERAYENGTYRYTDPSQ